MKSLLLINLVLNYTIDGKPGLKMDSCAIAPSFGHFVSWVPSAVLVTATPHRGMQRAQLLVQLTAVENSSNERLRRPAAVMAAYQFPLYAE